MLQKESPVIEFYSKEIEMDRVGDKFPFFEYVIILPFIEKERLLEAIKEADSNQKNLTDEERDRNKKSG